MDYSEACEFLFNLPSWARQGAYRPGLDRVRVLLEALGNPHLKYPVVHVAGTNGKGSVCAMVAAIMTAGGSRVGLHTSPHLFSFTERMRVDGEPASEPWIAETTTRLSGLISETSATFFEASTAMAFSCFADMHVDMAVVEVGMGGRLDATNIVEPAVCVITTVGFDHTEHLGTTLREIAGEKAGIIKDGVPVVSGCCDEDARAVIREKCAQTGSRLIETCAMDLEQYVKGLHLDLGGAHQRTNAVVALEAVRLLTEGRKWLRPDIHTGLAETRRLSGLRGRCDILSTEPLIVADVAHNVEGLEVAMRFIREFEPDARLQVLIGVSRGKDLDGMLEVLKRYDADVFVADVAEPRLIPAPEFASAARRKGLRIVEIGSPREIVKVLLETSVPDISLLATGSHYVVGSLPSELFEAAPTK